MARIRSIKPEFWVSEQIAECSTNARLTFVGLWNFSDDNGVHPAKPRTLKAELYPMDDFTAEQVGAWVDELIGAGLVALFTAEGQEYWVVTGWAQHQKIDRPSYKHPAPPQISTAPRRVLDDSSTNTSDDSSSATPRIGVDRSGVDRSGDSEFDESSSHPPEAAIAADIVSIPLKDGTEHPVEASQLSELQAAYPGVDVVQTLRQMRVWAIANPTKRKTRSGIAKHIVGWLGREQINGKAQTRPGSTIDALSSPTPQWAKTAGFKTIFEAENAGCGAGNYRQFQNGQRCTA